MAVSRSNELGGLAGVVGGFAPLDSGLLVPAAYLPIPKNNYTATTDPAVTDDTGDGYSAGSQWVNVSADTVYICVDASSGAAVWLPFDAVTRGSGAPSGDPAETGPYVYVDTATGDHYAFLNSAWVGPLGFLSTAFVDYVLGLSGLVAYWRLDETSGTTAADSGPNGLDLTVSAGAAVNGASLLGGGQAGGSFDLTPGAGDFLSHADDALLDLGDAVTMMAIIRPDSVSSTRGIISKGGNAYYLRTNGTNLEFLRAGSSVIVASTGIALATGTTYLVFGAKSGATTKLNINGVDRTGSVTNDTLTNNTAALFVGQQSAGSETFDGRMAEIAIWSRALSDTEMADLFTASGL